MEALWKWVRPGQNGSSEASEESSWLQDPPDDDQGPRTREDQLNMQAYMYSLRHPEFLRELAAAEGLSTATRGPASSPLNLSQLDQHFNALLKPSLPTTVEGSSGHTENKMAMLLQGRLQWEDPAASQPPVLNWVKEEKSRRRDLEQRRQERMAKNAQLVAQQSVQQQRGGTQKQQRNDEPHVAEESDVDEDWEARYELHASTLAVWEEADRAVRRPLSRRAPRARLTIKDSRGAHTVRTIPTSWQSGPVRQTPGIQSQQLTWRLPWA